MLVERSIDLPLASGRVISVVGPRRSGKTFLLFQTMRKLLKNGVKKEQIIYVNFEDERLLPYKTEDLDLIIEAWKELNPDAEYKPIIFLDEPQNVNGWEKFVRRLYEKKTQIFLSGSSSKLLSEEIATALRGMSLAFKIYPFSFAEYLKFRQIETDKNFAHTDAKYKIKQAARDYLKFGALPETFNLPPDLKVKYLQSWIDLVLYRDVIERHEIRSGEVLKQLTRDLILQTSCFFSLSAYFNMLKNQGLAVSKDTLFEFFGHLFYANLIFTSSFFTRSFKQKLVNPKKIYAIDQGLLSALSFDEEKGKLLETAVAIEMKRRGAEIFYYKGKREVDLITKKNGRIEAIQVCVSLENEETRKREFEGLLEFMEKFNLKTGLIISNDSKYEEKINGRLIQVVPFWEWAKRDK